MFVNGVTWATDYKELQNEVTSLNNRGFRVVNVIPKHTAFIILYEKERSERD